MDQNGSFVCVERDQQSQNNEEGLKDKVHLKFKTKSMSMCVKYNIVCGMVFIFNCILVYLMYFVLYL